jgi:putative spermidine/putrescine transport system permease protein
MASVVDGVLPDARSVPVAGPPAKRAPVPLAWLGLVPFFLFALLFLVGPTVYLIFGAFQDPSGALTLANIQGLFTPQIMAAYWISIRISVASAALGALIGFFIAYAIVHGGLPGWIRPTIVTFSGVASNFAGIPLAFAFLATLGRLGLVTVFLNESFGINIYRLGFNLLSFWA